MFTSTDIPNNDLIGSLELQDPKWETFANEYFKDPNAKQAAMVAGISEVSAGKMGHTWLRNPKIKARIEYLQSQAKKAASITEEDIIEQLGLILKSNRGDYYLNEDTGEVDVRPDKNGHKDLRKLMAIESVTIVEQVNGTKKATFKLWNKVAALQLAMNWKNMLKGDRTKDKDSGGDNDKGKDWRKKLAEYIGIPEEDLPS